MPALSKSKHSEFVGTEKVTIYFVGCTCCGPCDKIDAKHTTVSDGRRAAAARVNEGCRHQQGLGQPQIRHFFYNTMPSTKL